MGQCDNLQLMPAAFRLSSGGSRQPRQLQHIFTFRLKIPGLSCFSCLALDFRDRRPHIYIFRDRDRGRGTNLCVVPVGGNRYHKFWRSEQVGVCASV